MKSVFCIPVFNQINELPKLIEELNDGHYCDQILLVNNGSSDGSEDIVRNSKFPYIDLERNMGVGYSNIAGIEWALENGFDIFGTMAANGKMLPSELNRLIDPILNNEADITSGSRFLEGGGSPNLPAFRLYSIPAVSTFVSLLVGTKLTDATCGYSAYKLDLIKKANFDWKAEWLHSYSFEYYIYAKAILNKEIRYIEVPITMKYPPRNTNYSKIKPFISWWEMLKPWIVARLDGKEINW